MRVWITLLVLAVGCLIAAGASADDKKKDGPRKPRATAEERFAQMDTDKNNNVSQAEFAAAHKQRMGEDKAKELFKKMGGCPEKGLTLEQYKKARAEWEKKMGEHRKGEKKEGKKHDKK